MLLNIVLREVSPTARLMLKMFGVCTGTGYHRPMQLAGVPEPQEQDHVHSTNVLPSASGLNTPSCPAVPACRGASAPGASARVGS